MANSNIEINKIEGKVLVKETLVGVPNVIVTAYDIDLEPNRDEVFNTSIDPGVDFWSKFKNGDRLGSVVTDKNGLFSLIYDDNAFRSNYVEKRPDIILVVTAPEQQGIEPCPTILYISCNIRKNAGRIENFIVWIPSQLLAKVGIKVVEPSTTSGEQEPKDIVKEMENKYSRERKIEVGTKAIISKRNALNQQIRNDVNAKVQEFVTSLSKLPTDSSNQYAGAYVKPGENIEKATDQVIAKAIQNVVNTVSLKKHVSVSQDQLASLQDTSGNFRTNIPSDEV